jgi:hypothetical protein
MSDLESMRGAACLFGVVLATLALVSGFSTALHAVAVLAGAITPAASELLFVTTRLALTQIALLSAELLLIPASD